MLFDIIVKHMLKIHLPINIMYVSSQNEAVQFCLCNSSWA